MRHLPVYFILCTVTFINEMSCYLESPPVLENNRIRLIDDPITFTFTNLSKLFARDTTSYEYRFKFEQFPQNDKTIVSTSYQVEYTVIFESSATTKPGKYPVQVDVWYCPLGVPSHSIGTVRSTFELEDALYVTIDVDQLFSNAGSNYLVSTAKTIQLTARILPDSVFFDSANITYEWTVNGSPQDENKYDKFIQRNFSQVQLNNISVIVTATKTIGNRLIQKFGSENITLQSKDPIANVTVDGATHVKQFERLLLNVKVNEGTPPFEYYHMFTMLTPHHEVNIVLSHSNESLFSITNYFSEKGTRTLQIELKNDVSSFLKTMNISVY